MDNSSFIKVGIMSKSSLVKYLNLRLIVGYLGEKSQFGWWSTAFYEPSSRAFLEPVFPKTYQLAQYNGVKEAGRLLHDKYIGVGSVFHLFRLPEKIEQDLHNLMLEKQSDEILMSKLKSKEVALEFLSGIADGFRDVFDGPIKVGEIKNIHTSGSLKAMAQNYLAAFQQGKRTYPYFIGRS